MTLGPMEEQPVLLTVVEPSLSPNRQGVHKRYMSETQMVMAIQNILGVFKQNISFIRPEIYLFIYLFGADTMLSSSSQSTIIDRK